MLVLPKEKSVPKINNPKFLILAGRPKYFGLLSKKFLIELP